MAFRRCPYQCGGTRCALALDVLELELAWPVIIYDDLRFALADMPEIVDRPTYLPPFPPSHIVVRSTIRGRSNSGKHLG